MKSRLREILSQFGELVREHLGDVGEDNDEGSMTSEGMLTQ